MVGIREDAEFLEHDRPSQGIHESLEPFIFLKQPSYAGKKDKGLQGSLRRKKKRKRKKDIDGCFTVDGLDVGDIFLGFLQNGGLVLFLFRVGEGGNHVAEARDPIVEVVPVPPLHNLM